MNVSDIPQVLENTQIALETYPHSRSYWIGIAQRKIERVKDLQIAPPGVVLKAWELSLINTAIMYHLPELVEPLIKANALLTSVGLEKEPLVMAVEYREAAVARLLLQHTSYSDKVIQTAFHQAVETEQPECVRILMENGLRVNATHLPLFSHAKTWEYSEIVALMAAAAGPGNEKPYERQRRDLQAEAQAYADSPPDEQWAGFFARGKATAALREIVAGGMLKEFFSPDLWQDSRKSEHGRKLYHAIRNALPEYRGIIDAVDLVFLSVDMPTPSFVAQVRKPTLPPSGRR